MPRRLFLLLVTCFISTVAFAQSVQKGIVYENKTRVVLQGVRIENAKTGSFVVSDKDGKFTIPAHKGDLLYFKALFYQPDTVLLTDLLEREIHLTPSQNMLKEVNVSGMEIKTRQGAFSDPSFHNQTMVYQRDENGNYKGGISARLHYWNKDEKKKQKEADFLQNQGTQDEITRLFSPENIAKYVPLKGEDLDNFILLYKPSVKVYTEPGFNLTNYLNISYKKFMELPADKRTGGQLNK